jgi:thiamine biosynthesis lipoprotein
MTSHSSEVRRCRPLLGTFVEIGAGAASAERANAAIEAAFAAISQVHRLMSFHDDESDVARVNREAARRSIEVAPWTYEVLQAARDFHLATGGAFDITVAPRLQRWGYLPAARDLRDSGEPVTDQAAIEMLPGRRVRFRRPVRIDLGGIAKGFAVDRAIDALHASGASSGVVNAGGDLRVFGPAPKTIHVRDPRAPGRALPLLQVENAAVATSASYFARRKWRGRWVSPLVDPRRDSPVMRATSVSVRAATCMAADALTKVVMLLGQRSAAILRDHAATAFFLTRSGDVLATEGGR